MAATIRQDREVCSGSMAEVRLTSRCVCIVPDSVCTVADMHLEDSEVAIKSADVFLVCELMMDFPYADCYEMTY